MDGRLVIAEEFLDIQEDEKAGGAVEAEFVAE